LTTIKSDLSIHERAPDPPSQRLPRRQGSVLETVTSVLADAAEPMRVRDIHTAVTELLAAPVPYSSVKDALSAHSDRADRRFRRTRRGCYALS
jgi:hypothetical protein